ncbi:MAG TPA: ATP-binding protein [Candidatus Saccharimonadales bacterium]|nr:ATP-binding protein [Candidatus Saccharimonadales bacterium]
MIEKLLELLMPSRLEYLGVLAKVVEGLQGPLDLSEEELYAASTALIEAGTNAIQHGGSPDLSPVRVTLEAGDGQLVIVVEDEGRGFDLSRIDSHVADLDHLFNSRGRGIFIMRSLMDDVQFSFGRERGTRVRLRMNRKANGA